MICPRCQNEVQGQPAFCSTCGCPLENTAVDNSNKEPGVNLLLFRYKNAYRVANTTNEIGVFVKWCGCGLAVLLFFASLRLNFELGAMAVFSAILCGGFFFVLGILISGIGQIQLAALDTAVYASTFLTNDERAQIISLQVRRRAASV